MTIFDIAITDHHAPAKWHTDGDPVWVEARPNLRRIYVLAGDILATLGKRRDIAGKGRNESQDVHLAVAWLRAHDTPDLIVTGAERLHPRILNSLTRLAADADVDLWLLHRSSGNDLTHMAIARHSTGRRRLSDIPQPQEPSALPPDQGADFPEVPRHDFHVFVAAVEKLVPAEGAGLVLQGFERTFLQTSADARASTNPQDSIAASILATLQSAPGDNELITRVRAIQLAAWHCAYHLSVDLTTLLNSEERPTVRPADAAPHLLSYRQPYRAISWVLAANHVGLDEIARLTTGAVRDASIVTEQGPIDVDPRLRPVLRAQLELRGRAETDCRLIPLTTKTISKSLVDAAIDLNLPCHGRVAERDNVSAQTRLRRLGLEIRSIS